MHIGDDDFEDSACENSGGCAGPFDVNEEDLSADPHVQALVAAALRSLNEFDLPADVAGLGPADLMAFAVGLLGKEMASGAADQITNVLTRFGLDLDRPADVLAAAAYVWSTYNLPVLMSARPSGSGLDEASQAAMRCVLVNPDALLSMLRGPPRRAEKALGRIIDAATAGLINYEQRIGARPRGVAPELQTTTYAARKAIAKHRRDAAKGQDSDQGG
jgi:hypothetical protein